MDQIEGKKGEIKQRWNFPCVQYKIYTPYTRVIQKVLLCTKYYVISNS